MSTAEILKAVKTVVKMKGGLAVVVGDQVLAELNLPIAGLMSLSSAREVRFGKQAAWSKIPS